MATSECIENFSLVDMSSSGVQCLRSVNDAMYVFNHDGCRRFDFHKTKLLHP
jgi:hypothetical protein